MRWRRWRRRRRFVGLDILSFHYRLEKKIWEDGISAYTLAVHCKYVVIYFVFKVKNKQKKWSKPNKYYYYMCIKRINKNMKKSEKKNKLSGSTDPNQIGFPFTLTGNSIWKFFSPPGKWNRWNAHKSINVLRLDKLKPIFFRKEKKKQRTKKNITLI